MRSGNPAVRGAALDQFKKDQEACEEMIPIIGAYATASTSACGGRT